MSIAQYRTPKNTPSFSEKRQDIAKWNTLSPQCKKVIGLIRRDGHVTRHTALLAGNIMNLTARVSDLRAAGFNIGCKIKADINGNEYGWFYEVNRKHNQEQQLAA